MRNQAAASSDNEDTEDTDQEPSTNTKRVKKPDDRLALRVFYVRSEE